MTTYELRQQIAQYLSRVMKFWAMGGQHLPATEVESSTQGAVAHGLVCGEWRWWSADLTILGSNKVAHQP